MMEDGKSTISRWEDLEIDALVKIFMELNVVELAAISRVCGSWRLACSDPLLWKTLDLGMLESNFITIPSAPYIWVDDRSYKKLTRVLKISMGLSRGSVNCIIFRFNLYPKDDQLIYVAERSPRLKHLVLPAWDLLTEGGICKAICKWEELESMTMPYINSSQPHIMKEISQSCKNFTQLKIMNRFTVPFASAIVAFLPKLKVLSLRCSILFNEALVMILDCMQDLEVLNISHCVFVVETSPLRVMREIDETIIEKASRLRAFFYCQNELCVLCQQMFNYRGIMKWNKYEEGLWRSDEVSSLVH